MILEFVTNSMDKEFFVFYGAKIFITVRVFRFPLRCRWDLRSSTLFLKMGPIGCPETPVTNYQLRCVTSQKGGDFLHYRVHKNSRLVDTFFQMSPVRMLTHSFFSIWRRHLESDVSCGLQTAKSSWRLRWYATAQPCQLRSKHLLWFISWTRSHTGSSKVS